jgi:hypothetical protein
MDGLVRLEASRLVEFILLSEEILLHKGSIEAEYFEYLTKLIKDAKERLIKSKVGKLVESCPFIPANRKLLFICHLYKCADTFHHNDWSEKIKNAIRKDDETNTKKIEKEIEAIKKVMLKTADSNFLEQARDTVSKFELNISAIGFKPLPSYRPTDVIKRRLALSFLSIWKANTNDSKVNRHTLELAAQFMYELGYGIDDDGVLICYGPENIDYLFDSISEMPEDSAFYLVKK